MDNQRVSWPLAESACYSLLGGAFGFLGAALVWEYIYGIGSRVVSDELYVDLREAIRVYGAVAGVCSGFIVRVVPNPRPTSSFALLHGCSVMAGMVGGHFGWAAGLAGYFGMHAAAVMGCSMWVVVLALRKAIHRTRRCT